MSEMKKIYITGLWLLCIVYGVSAQTYDIIERRNSWNTGKNVTGIRMDSISSSYAELYGKNNHGDFHHSYEAEKSWNAGAIAKSITHLKGYSLTGSFSFDHTSGKDMSGSMFIQPGFYPVDILEFTPGRKTCNDTLLWAVLHQILHLTGDWEERLTLPPPTIPNGKTCDIPITGWI